MQHSTVGLSDRRAGILGGSGMAVSAVQPPGSALFEIRTRLDDALGSMNNANSRLLGMIDRLSPAPRDVGSPAVLAPASDRGTLDILSIQASDLANAAGLTHDLIDKLERLLG